MDKFQPPAFSDNAATALPGSAATVTPEFCDA
jgi:hypothetical protein